MEKVGFVEVEFVGETGLDSSPVTRGVLFRARKPTASEVRMVEADARADRKDSTTGLELEDMASPVGQGPPS